MRISDWSSDVCSSDLDGDGKDDIVLCDAKQIAWYRNPSWEKFVIAENLTARDHVCVAARDLDGDGRAEIAEIGRASCRERVCQSVSISVVAVSLKKKKDG